MMVVIIFSSLCLLDGLKAFGRVSKLLVYLMVISSPHPAP
jgi:hypothetical protein